MVICRQCGKELTNPYSTDICLDCSRENVKKIFKEYPEVKQAFKESIDELKKPENMKRMAGDIVRFMQAIQDIQKKGVISCRRYIKDLNISIKTSSQT